MILKKNPGLRLVQAGGKLTGDEDAGCMTSQRIPGDSDNAACANLLDNTGSADEEGRGTGTGGEGAVGVGATVE